MGSVIAWCRRLVAALSVTCLSIVPSVAGPLCTAETASPAIVEEVAPGVFVRPGKHALMAADNHGAIANIGFIVGVTAIAVVDTGGSACDGYRLRAAIRANSALPIRYVINTHVHPDHVFGNSAFEQDRPVFVGHRNLARALSARGAHYLEANRELMGEDALTGTQIVAPDLAVDDRYEIDLGGRTIELMAHPTGHTDNDLTVLDKTTGTLWTGDLVFLEHLPVIDGSLKGWLAVTAALKQAPAVRAVPGHGPISVPWPAGVAPFSRRKRLRPRKRRKPPLRNLVGEKGSYREAWPPL